MVSFEECVKGEKLEIVQPSMEKALELIEKAECFLNDSKKILLNGMPNSALINAYLSFLDASRALMAADGWREKQNHACVVAFIRAKYGTVFGTNLIYSFDKLRETRNKTQYSPSFYPTEQEAKEAIRFADEFVNKTWKILEERKP
ncbi:MAG: HEPN domain-containing protein [Candidatus Micrarchaeota archaeon]